MREGEPSELAWHVNAVPRVIVWIAEAAIVAGLAIWTLGGAKFIDELFKPKLTPEEAFLMGGLTGPYVAGEFGRGAAVTQADIENMRLQSLAYRKSAEEQEEYERMWAEAEAKEVSFQASYAAATEAVKARFGEAAIGDVEQRRRGLTAAPGPVPAFTPTPSPYVPSKYSGVSSIDPRGWTPIYVPPTTIRGLEVR